jgi:hypothetical protein
VDVTEAFGPWTVGVPGAQRRGVSTAEVVDTMMAADNGGADHTLRALVRYVTSLSPSVDGSFERIWERYRQGKAAI